jgi:hypothetical protein
MTTDPTKFVCPAGLAYPTAIALAAEIDADEPRAENLVSGFVADFLAVELVRQIRSGVPDTNRLRELLVGPELVAAIAAAIIARHQDRNSK